MLADKIKHYRLNNGLTQGDFAEVIHAAQNTVSGYESGNRTPGVKRLFAIAQLLGCTVDELLEEGNDNV